MASAILNLPRPIAIIGMGKSGEASLQLLVEVGIPRSDLFTFDEKKVDVDFSSPTKLMAEGKPRTLLVSPGVPLSSPWIQKFLREGGHLTSELEIAFSQLKQEKVLCVTGSVGKSTTVSLLEAGIIASSESVFAGGNLGTPLAEYALDILNKKRERAIWVVLELSSFQLENFSNLKSIASAITSFTSNHLERYKSKDEYFRTKWSLVEKTLGPVVLNSHSSELKTYASRYMGKKELIWSSSAETSIPPDLLTEASLPGSHNKDNIAIAAALLNAAGLKDGYLKGLLTYRGLPHRMENLGKSSGGIQFVNDSKATTMESVLIAATSLLESSNNGTLWLLLGGRDKNLPWKELHSLQDKARLRFVFFGECRDEAQRQSKLSGQTFARLADAVHSLKSLAVAGDLILLSPGGTSLDEFKNFEDRGLQFKNYVKKTFGELRYEK